MLLGIVPVKLLLITKEKRLYWIHVFWRGQFPFVVFTIKFHFVKIRQTSLKFPNAESKRNHRNITKIALIWSMKKMLLFFTCCLLLISFRHPYHVGSVEINYNSNSKTYEIVGRFFMDDLENALNKKYGTTLHFGDEKFKPQLNGYLAKYSNEYFRLKSDNQFVKINFLGYEEDRESVEIYLESEPVKPPKKVEAAVSFLYNYFDDQLNIVHIIVNGQRKSQKISYPDRYLFQNF